MRNSAVFLFILTVGAILWPVIGAAQPIAAASIAFSEPRPPKPSNIDVLEQRGDVERLDRSVPFSLTSSDGSGLVLRRVEARVVLDGPLAWTELWLTFHNPEPRVREGRFTVTLPPDAALGRFAMRIADAWMEGEVVEKHQAEVAYDDFLHARQDPAILTKDAGNQFSARVFPIAASADKELVLAWSQPIADPSAPFVLPLAGLPKVAELGLHAWVLRAGSPQVLVDVERKGVLPLQDLQLWPQTGASDDATAVQNGDKALVRVRVQSANATAPMPNLTLLFDTSASASPDFARRLARLQEVVALAARSGTIALHIVAFDQVQVPVYDGAPDGFGATQLDSLRKRGALGASNLGAALAYVRQHKHTGDVRLVLLSDCLATAGETATKALRQDVEQLAGAGVQRLDVVLPDGARNQDVATALVAAGLPLAGTVVRGAEGNLARLTRAVLPPVDVRVPGAAWSWPTQVTGLQPGDAFLVTAQLEPNQPLRVRLTGGAVGELNPEVRPGSAALVRRAAAAAQIARLESQLSDANEATATALKKQLVELSVSERLLSSQSAFLVLETEADYARYHIDRANPTPLLAIAAKGDVQAVKRGDPALALRSVGDARPEAQREVAYRQGPGDGTVTATGNASGRGSARAASFAASAAASTKLFADDDGGAPAHGMGFGGSGAGGGGASLGERQAARASVRSSPPPETKPTARGAAGAAEGASKGEAQQELSKMSVRSGSPAGRCYEAVLRNDPDFSARVTVYYVVGTQEQITSVTVLGATGAIADCIAAKFKSIRGLPKLPEPLEFKQTFVFGTPPPRPETPEEKAANERFAADQRKRQELEAFRAAVAKRIWVQEHRQPTTAERREVARQAAEASRLKNEEAARERAYQREQARERRDEEAQARAELDAAVAELQPVYDRRVAIGRCMTAGGTRTDRASVSVEIAESGALRVVEVAGATEPARQCVVQTLRGAKVRKPSDQGAGAVTMALLRDGDSWRYFPTPQGLAAAFRHRPEMEEAAGDSAQCRLGPSHAELEVLQAATYNGDLASLPDPAALRYGRLNDQLAAGKATQVRDAAWQWHLAQPGEILPLVAYGRALLKSDSQQAARAFGSLIDLHPARADIRRFAANLLESTGAHGQGLAADSYAASQKLRPDHISGYAQRALALARTRHYAAALDLLAESLTAEKRQDAARMSADLARDAFGLVAAAWLAAEPGQKAAIEKRLAAVDAKLPSGPALRFLLTWETDGNDVDFHVGDAKGVTACYSSPTLDSGGRLFEDVTTGYGPEWFAIDAPAAFPYTISAHYYARGPMGFGMGRVLVVRWNGNQLTFEDRPFIVTMDDESVRLGVVGR